MISDSYTLNSGPILAIVGETASGKSALAMRLAQRLNGEIVCADSGSLRRKMDIGTAKPSHQDQLLVKHHLIDIINPDKSFSAAQFKRLATEVVNDIASRGKLPILVGGTGLYIDGLLYDYQFLPESNPAHREELNSLTIEQLIQKIDEAHISRLGIDWHNPRRLIRLLETSGATSSRQSLRPNTLLIGIKTDLLILRNRVEDRTDQMIRSGLEDEVTRLAEQYAWTTPGLLAVGYHEWKEYILGSQTLAQTQSMIVSATMHLAKRQRTWFKRNKSIHWFNNPEKFNDIDDLITTSLNK